MHQGIAADQGSNRTHADAADEKLAEKLQNGDNQAMGELYDRYEPVVFSIAVRLVRDPAVAEDLVQETFLRVWTSIGTFDNNRGSLGSWVGTIARNRVLDYLRSADFRTRHAARDLRYADRRPVLSALTIEEIAENAPMPAGITRAMERLDRNHRRVIEMAFLEGLTQNEIAGRIQRPLGTVKAWSRSALKSLRESCVSL